MTISLLSTIFVLATPVAEPVNSHCPISREPIVASAGTVEHDGATVACCCPGCLRPFAAWSDERKSAFVAAAKRGESPPARGATRDRDDSDTSDESADGKSRPWSDPYPLSTCPVSGAALGSMGDPAVRTIDGREVRFCCPPCIPTFEADPAKHWRKIDEAIIKDQRPLYPLTTCIVSGEQLPDDGVVEVVVGNRLVRLCCPACEKPLRDEAHRHMKRLDEAVAAKQRPDYPLTTCIVAGARLGSMGEPTELVIAGRLFRFCCASCEPKVKTEPAKYITTLDEARQR